MQLKKCNSCHRLLTYDQYGILRSSPDGYRPTCKACCNYRAKKTYQRKKEGKIHTPDIQIPLAEHNYISLSKIFPSSMPKSSRINQSVSPRDVNPGQVYTLNLSYRDGLYRFELLNDLGEMIVKTYYKRQDNIEHIVSWMSDELTKRSIILESDANAS